MYSNNRNGNRAAPARGFTALCAVLAMGLGLMASPAGAAPFAYVANVASGTISVIDTATNPPSVVATVEALGGFGVAVTPDGKHAYVANAFSTSVSVIATATNKVVATVGVGKSPYGVAVTPDGKHAYVANFESGTVFESSTVSVIATASNTVVATVPAWAPGGIAFTPDGKFAYVTDGGTSSVVSVFATAGTPPTLVTTIGVGTGPFGIAITPDGKFAYVANSSDNTVSVIATASNTVVGTPITVGMSPFQIAITPDGKYAYVTNEASANVSVIATASNTVAATVSVGNNPRGVGIIPPPPTVPFLAFNAALEIHFGSKPNTDAFALESSFTLSSTAPAINPVTQAVTLQVGTFTTTIPPGSFKMQRGGLFTSWGSSMA
jgi:YVTN family beta-propeller protein